MDPLSLARQEREDLAEFLESLRPEQWDRPSLCHGWRIRDVAAHVVSYEEQRPNDLIKQVLAARLRLSRLNDLALAEYSARDPHELALFLRQRPTPRGVKTAFGGRVALVDAMIHHQDMRRPLDMPRQIPAERLLCALPFAVTAPPLRGFWHARGVRLIASDLEWSWGRDPVAQGPAEAVLMVLAGRATAAGDLTGPGASILQHRLG